MASTREPVDRPRGGGFLTGLTRLFLVLLLTPLLVLGVWFAGLRAGWWPDVVAHDRTITNEQVVAALTKEQQVVLLSLGVQGLVSEEAKTKVFGIEVPGSQRIQFVQYSYQAKLGLPGDKVTIEPTGDKAFRLTIPEFVFIGHDKEQFKVAVEQNGALSWTTPRVDTAALVTKVLSDSAKTQQVADNREILQDQTRTFYGAIVRGVDPTARLDFVFTGR